MSAAPGGLVGASSGCRTEAARVREWLPFRATCYKAPRYHEVPMKPDTGVGFCDYGLHATNSRKHLAKAVCNTTPA